MDNKENFSPTGRRIIELAELGNSTELSMTQEVARHAINWLKNDVRSAAASQSLVQTLVKNAEEKAAAQDAPPESMLWRSVMQSGGPRGRDFTEQPLLAEEIAALAYLAARQFMPLDETCAGWEKDTLPDEAHDMLGVIERQWDLEADSSKTFPPDFASITYILHAMDAEGTREALALYGLEL